MTQENKSDAVGEISMFEKIVKEWDKCKVCGHSAFHSDFLKLCEECSPNSNHPDSVVNKHEFERMSNLPEQKFFFLKTTEKIKEEIDNLPNVMTNDIKVIDAIWKNDINQIFAKFGAGKK